MFGYKYSMSEIALKLVRLASNIMTQNLMSFLSLLVALLALIVSIKSCAISEKVFKESSRPSLVVMSDSDKVVVRNEGKGAGVILKSAYSLKSSLDLKCLDEIEKDSVFHENYDIDLFNDNESLGGSRVILTCISNCKRKYHQKYDFFFLYSDVNNERKEYTRNLNEESYDLLDAMQCI